ncbi:MAG: M15 family metallopeptidase [bacterium]|nr:M15 family metallopeptidase [bacterium]MCM1374618.1 M15 family metallopeptidase [Muribaculum sp.]
MNHQRNILLKGLAAIAAVIVICFSISKLIGIGSPTLDDLAKEYPQPTASPSADSEPSEESSSATVTEPDNTAYPIETPMESSDAMSAEHPLDNSPIADIPTLTGASLNGEQMAYARITWKDGFYYEPLSEALAMHITGISYPEDIEDPAIALMDLSYVHVLHYNFEGESAEGELICNQAIAQDLVEIFWELYQAEYQIERIRLIDEYGGDDDLSMEDNNTSCFNYRVVSGSTSLSKHAYGLAIDINPLYNPYITYNKDQTFNVSPAAGEEYADRSRTFPYKIDENDLCYRLFKERGFTWGGDWNSCKDYQHFQKTP